MHCGACDRDNRDGAGFCAGCGSKLVAACRACGAELADDARFCDSCGSTVETAAAAESAAPIGDRKVVTVVFADMSGSTSLQERLDAEATRRVMAGAQATLRSAVEGHGGRVIKTMGDGMMAVFGIPIVREDDAVRAVRAGVAMQVGFAGLGLTDVALRVGVNTGEVVVSPDTDDIVGDPVNVAARLEASAGLGDVLVGGETQRLVRDVIALEPVEPLTVKGKAEPIAAARVVGVSVGAAPAATAFLGRDDDMATLTGSLDEAIATSSTRLVTVLGWPGLGKSRLAAELSASVAERATVVEVRFVADGGTSFGPIADALRHVVDADDVELGGSTEQVFWSIRRALEGLAAARPLVVVLDDLHWAEPAMLDLVEHLAEWMRGVPALLLALARPELRDLRPSLLDATGPSSNVVVLGGLAEGACRQLALDVLDAPSLPEGVLGRALDASEGNPLFLRELLRLLVDDGVLVRGPDDAWALTVDVDAIEMPATIHAALAARIEQLQPDERRVLQAASVIGRHFARGAVAALLPPLVAGRLDEHLSSLHRRSLVDSEGSWWDDERMFRFHHVLIRDAAYRRVLKEVRAEQHVRYADWLAARVGDAVADYDEVLGHHLEQAIGCQRELGEPVDGGIVERAVQHLASAGRRAHDRDDLANAVALLGRALGLRADDAELLNQRCDALVASGNVRAAAEAVAQLAAIAPDERFRALADLYDAQLASQRLPRSLRDVATRAASAASLLAELGDDIGVAKAESVQATALAGLGQVAACEAALDRSLAAARRAGDTRRANVVLSLVPSAVLWGPATIARASGRCLDVVRVLRITTWAPHVEASALRSQAVLEALRGRADAARQMLATARQTFTDLGHRLGLLDTAQHSGIVELLDGDASSAEAYLREAVDGYEAMGMRASSARATALLARALLEQGRLDEAEVLADPVLAGDDLKASIGLLGVAAEILAGRGAINEAEALARRAVALAEPTDALVDHADARLALAKVLRAAGRDAESTAELERARALYEAKGATVGVRRCGDVVSSPPVGAVDGVGRRVASNVATRSVDRWVDAMRADDADIDALYRGDCIIHDVSMQTDLPLAEHRAVETALRRADRDPYVETLTAIGERHCLVALRWRFTDDGLAGDVDAPRLSVVRVDDDGRFARLDVVDEPERLSLALACLIQRWAEDELDGPDRARSLQVAFSCSAGELVAAGDWDGFGDLFAEDAVLVDHRPTGAAHHGRDAIVSWHRAAHAAAPGMRVAIVDLLALTPDLSFSRHESVGVLAGGTFDNSSYLVSRYAADGRLSHLDQFGLEQLQEAWVCVDAYTSIGRRRVPTTTATRAQQRWLAAARRRDRPVLDAHYAPGYVIEHHGLQAEMTSDYSSGIDELAEQGGEVDVEILGALGDLHVLTRVTARDRTEQAELVLLVVNRMDVDGRGVLDDVFDADQMEAAVACLYERWAEAEGSDADRVRMGVAARTFDSFRAVDAHDWDAYRTYFSEDAVLVDHRIVGPDGPVHSVDSFVYVLARSIDDAMQAKQSIRDVLALDEQAALLECSYVGEIDGIVFATTNFTVARHDASGHTDRVEIFEHDRLADAFACFDGFVATARRVVPNLASATVDRSIELMRRDDVAAIADLYAPGLVWANHSVQAEMDGQQHRDVWEMMRAGAPRREMELLATLGEHHVLTRLTMHYTDAEHGGLVEWPRLYVSSVLPDGRFIRFDTFDTNDLSSALECLAQRESMPRRRVVPNEATAAVARWHEAMRQGDVAAIDARHTAAYEIHHHEIQVVVDWAASREGEQSLIGASEITVEPIAALGERHAMHRVRIERVDTDFGGEVLHDMYLVSRADADGRVVRDDTFAPEQLVQAVICLIERWAEDELDGLARDRALRSARVWTVGDLVTRGDWDGYREHYSTDVVMTDYEASTAGAIEGIDALVAWVSGGALGHDPDGAAASITDVLALTPDASLWQWLSVGSALGGTYEIPRYIAVRFGLDGRIDRVSLFPIGQLDAAWACFDEFDVRVDAHPAVVHMRRWAAATEGHDFDAVGQLFALDFRAEDHRPMLRATMVGRDAQVAQAAAIPLGTRCTVTLVADRGPRLALLNLRFLVPTGDVVETLNLTLLDESGSLAVEGAILDPLDLDAALAQLDALAARDEHAAVAMLRRWAAAMIASDRSALVDVYAEDVRSEDRRTHVQMVTVGRDAHADQMLSVPTAGLELTPVLTSGEHCAVVHIVADTGLDGSVGLLVVAQVDDAGRLTHAVTFDEVDRAAALAELDAWVSAVPTNVARRTLDRWADAMRRGDVEGVAATYDSDAIHDERRGHTQLLARGVETFLPGTISGEGGVSVALETRATRGELLALVHATFVVDDAEIEVVLVAEVHPVTHQRVRTVMFEPTDLDAALAELDRRFAELNSHEERSL